MAYGASYNIRLLWYVYFDTEVYSHKNAAGVQILKYKLEMMAWTNVTPL